MARVRRESDCLWNGAHEDSMNIRTKRKQLTVKSINVQMSGKYGITRDYSKSRWKILRSQIMRKQVLKQKTPKTSSKVSLLHCACSLSLRGSKTFCLLPTNLATPENITGNNVSTTMFPSLARP